MAATSAASDSAMVAKVYEAFERLSAAAGDAQSEPWYISILDARKADQKAKQLAAQFIPRFFSQFPKLSEKALNAQLDLIEDPVLAIRMQAIPGLADICKGSPAHISRIADVLGQLLVAEEGAELAVVKKTFQALFALDAKKVFQALLAQIREAEDTLREKGIEFLKEQLERQRAVLRADAELQTVVADGIKGVLAAERALPEAEFRALFDVIRGLPAFRDNKELPKQLAEVLTAQAGLKGEFDPASEVAVQRLVTSMNASLPLFSKGVESAPFIHFFFGKVAPRLEHVAEKHRLALLKAVASTSGFVTADAARAHLPTLSELVKAALPLPEAQAGAAAAGAGEEKGDAAAAAAAPASAAPPKINFSAVECLLYALHQLCNASADAAKEVLGLFTPTGQPSDFRPGLKERREDLAARLSGLLKTLQPYEKQVQELQKALQAKLRASKEEEEKKATREKLGSVRLALITVDNVRRLATTLLKRSPVFLTYKEISLSWRPQPNKKRPAEEEKGADGNNQAKRRKVPGQGQLSSSSSSSQQQQQQRQQQGGAGRGGGGGGRRRNRGRGRGQ